jgi:hypothetical protein
MLLLAGALTAVLVSGTVVAVGLRGTSDPAAGPPRSPAAVPSTPLDQLDLSGLPIPRTPFCDQIDDRAVTAALGAPVARGDSYRDGDRAQLAPGLRDVAHENGCRFDATDGQQARAWVFAEPVRPSRARRITEQARRTDGCAPATGTPVFGTPSVALVCRAGRPATTVASLRGLFGDAWLTCQVSSPGQGNEARTLHRAVRWCVHVATVLGSQP